MHPYAEYLQEYIYKKSALQDGGKFKEYGDDLGIQSKEQHEKLVEELEKIKTKLK